MVVLVTWNRGSDTFGMPEDERDALAAEFVGKYAKALRELGYPVEQSTRWVAVTGPKQKKK
ncbi:hypothetical protein ACFV1L_06005 [Kitasatospora sp. NPDC059646]|uniref:hypothetical protein n=1 Tax=Kitasatospora sp. NPDC059646 TaxID=3346893 RepID=UPI00367440CC